MAEDISAAAGVVGAAVSIGCAIAQAVPTHRQCTVEIKNHCTHHSLSNPRVYLDSGGCAIPLSPFIASTNSDIAQFCKTPYTARGSVGVFTYDLLKTDADQPSEKIAVMFSVPYDFNINSNIYAVGVFDKSRECDKGLYHEMCYEAEKSFVRGKASGPCLSYKGSHFSIMAAMSDSYLPVMKVQVAEKKKAFSE